jgi:hypothetical protein
MQGQEPDEKLQPILKIEQPTGAWVDIGSLWPGWRVDEGWMISGQETVFSSSSQANRVSSVALFPTYQQGR